MLNTIEAELMKIKKSKIFVISTLIILSVPIFLIVKDLFFTRVPNNYKEWFMTGRMLNSIILPIMSGFIITVLVQREYQDRTIINVLTAPVSRKMFIISKLFVWLLWYVVVLIAVEVLNIIGCFLLYPDSFNLGGVQLLIKYFTKSGLFSFITSLPVLWVAIKQRNLYYPSILTAMVFTVIQMLGLNISMEMLPLASIVPWSAVSIISVYEIPLGYQIVCMISILAMGFLGLGLSIFSLKKQDQ